MQSPATELHHWRSYINAKYYHLPNLQAVLGVSSSSCSSDIHASQGKEQRSANGVQCGQNTGTASLPLHRHSQGRAVCLSLLCKRSSNPAHSDFANFKKQFWGIVSVTKDVTHQKSATSLDTTSHQLATGPAVKGHKWWSREAHWYGALDSWSKGCGFESVPEQQEDFLCQGQLSVLILTSVSVPPQCYCSCCST